MDFINLLLQQFNIDVELSKLIQKAGHIKQTHVGVDLLYTLIHIFLKKKLLTFWGLEPFKL